MFSSSLQINLPGGWSRRRMWYEKWALVCFIITLFVVGDAVGQSIHPDVFLRRPTAMTYTQLDHLQTAEKPQVGLFYSARTAALNPTLAPALDASIRNWELFLVGMELPYLVMEDSSLLRTIDEEIKLLIVPGAEVLGEQQRTVLKAYMERGGGVIASGRIGFFDDRGVLTNDRFFKDVFGAEPSIDLADSLNGLLQTLDGGHPPTGGVPPGFQLNIARPALGMAVLPITSKSMGALVPYETMQLRLVEQALRASTLLLHGMYGKGRFVWMGFNPQDVSPAPVHQAVYQGLVLNTMAYVAGLPMSTIRRWPHGFSSAATFAILPTLGYRPYPFRTGMDLVLNALARARVKGTFFTITERAVDHLDLIERMALQGEIAITSDTETMLPRAPRERQFDRLNHAKTRLLRYTAEVAGVYPPGGFYDANTLKALVDLELRYILSDANALKVPAFVNWEEELDYRDTLLAAQLSDSVQADASAGDLITFYPSLHAYTLDDRSGIGGAVAVSQLWKSKMEAQFEAQHRAAGLFLFAFEPETMGLTRQRAQVLEDFARYIRTQNTWIATLGDVAGWWKGRRQVSSSLEYAAEEGFVLSIANEGANEMRGLSIDLQIDRGRHPVLTLEGNGLEVWSRRDQDRTLLVIEVLPPGNHQITLKSPTVDAPSDATGDELN